MRKFEICKYHNVYWFDHTQDFKTGIFVIERPNVYYIIDTYCGSEAVDEVVQSLDDRDKIFINTHHHWDHIWGNDRAKKYGALFAHSKCAELIKSTFKHQYEENKQYQMGTVKEALPSVLFDDTCLFDTDDLLLFYSPGHTMDSISIYDRRQKVLYVGDNVERPIIYVEQPDVDRYITTLQSYLEMDVDYIVGSHTYDLTVADMKEAIRYLNCLKNQEEISFSTEYQRKVHQANQLMIQ